MICIGYSRITKCWRRSAIFEPATLVVLGRVRLQGLKALALQVLPTSRTARSPTRGHRCETDSFFPNPQPIRIGILHVQRRELPLARPWAPGRPPSRWRHRKLPLAQSARLRGDVPRDTGEVDDGEVCGCEQQDIPPEALGEDDVVAECFFGALARHDLGHRGGGGELFDCTDGQKVRRQRTCARGGRGPSRCGSRVVGGVAGPFLIRGDREALTEQEEMRNTGRMGNIQWNERKGDELRSCRTVPAHERGRGLDGKHGGE